MNFLKEQRKTCFDYKSYKGTAISDQFFWILLPDLSQFYFLKVNSHRISSLVVHICVWTKSIWVFVCSLAVSQLSVIPLSHLSVLNKAASVKKSKLALLAARQEVLRQGKWLYSKAADQEDGRLAPQNNHLIGVWMPDSFLDQRWGRWVSKVKRPLILQTFLEWQPQGGGVLISSFLPSIGGQGSEQRHFSLTAWQRGGVLLSKPLCMIIITKTMKSLSKKQFQHGVRINLLLLCSSNTDLQNVHHKTEI